MRREKPTCAKLHVECVHNTSGLGMCACVWGGGGDETDYHIEVPTSRCGVTWGGTIRSQPNTSSSAFSW